MKLPVVITVLLFAFGCNKNMGDPIPPFNLKTLDGNMFSSDQLTGKATVLVVWATWCGDCIREIPELNQLQEKYANNPDVAFVAMSDETVDKVSSSLARRPFNFVQIPNATEYTDKLKTGIVKHFPQVMVLNKNKTVVFDVTENKKPIYNDLDNEIQKILN